MKCIYCRIVAFFKRAQCECDNEFNLYSVFQELRKDLQAVYKNIDIMLSLFKIAKVHCELTGEEDEIYTKLMLAEETLSKRANEIHNMHNKYGMRPLASYGKVTADQIMIVMDVLSNGSLLELNKNTAELLDNSLVLMEEADTVMDNLLNKH